MDGSEGNSAAVVRLKAIAVSAEKLGNCRTTLLDEPAHVALVIGVYEGPGEGSRRFGDIVVLPVSHERESEEWTLNATCIVMPGLPMQADWLGEAARKVKAAFDALVSP